MGFSAWYVVYCQWSADRRNECAGKLCSRVSVWAKRRAVLELQLCRVYLVRPLHCGNLETVQRRQLRNNITGAWLHSRSCKSCCCPCCGKRAAQGAERSVSFKRSSGVFIVWSKRRGLRNNRERLTNRIVHFFSSAKVEACSPRVGLRASEVGWCRLCLRRDGPRLPSAVRRGGASCAVLAISSLRAKRPCGSRQRRTLRSASSTMCKLAGDNLHSKKRKRSLWPNSPPPLLLRHFV